MNHNALIAMPTQDRRGRSTARAAAALGRLIGATFGGHTAEIDGGHHVYRFTAEDTPEAHAKAVRLALFAGRKAQADEIDAIMPDGKAQQINTANEWRQAEEIAA